MKITIFRFVYYFLKMYGQIYTAEILCFHTSHFIFPNYVKNRGQFALKSRNLVRVNRKITVAKAANSF
jgi:hypothetical protein